MEYGCVMEGITRALKKTLLKSYSLNMASICYPLKAARSLTARNGTDRDGKMKNKADTKPDSITF